MEKTRTFFRVPNSNKENNIRQRTRKGLRLSHKADNPLLWGTEIIRSKSGRLIFTLIQTCKSSMKSNHTKTRRKNENF